jgi:hypothetical protein
MTVHGGRREGWRDLVWALGCRKPGSHETRWPRTCCALIDSDMAALRVPTVITDWDSTMKTVELAVRTNGGP